MTFVNMCCVEPVKFWVSFLLGRMRLIELCVQPNIVVINGDIYRPTKNALLEFSSSEDNVKNVDVNRCKIQHKNY